MKSRVAQDHLQQARSLIRRIILLELPHADDTNRSDTGRGNENRFIFSPSQYQHSAFVSSPLPSPLRRLLFLTAKIAIVIMVLVAVAHSFRDAFAQLDDQIWILKPQWLVAAGTLYLASLLPMALFWQSLLAGLSQRPGFLKVFRSYCLGHLAKYVPGKALTLMVRSAGVRTEGSLIAPIIASVFLETLTLMAVGGCLSALLLHRVLPDRAAYPLLTALFAVATILPTIPPVTSRILQWALRRRHNPETADIESVAPEYGWRLFVGGWFAASISWLFMGLSIWATARAAGGENAAAFEQLDLWIVAAAMPVVAGFLSMIPGGLVVRDGLMFQLLSPSLGEPTALVVTALIRLAWLVAECVACGILEIANRWRRSD